MAQSLLWASHIAVKKKKKKKKLVVLIRTKTILSKLYETNSQRMLDEEINNFIFYETFQLYKLSSVIYTSKEISNLRLTNS